VCLKVWLFCVVCCIVHVLLLHLHLADWVCTGAGEGMVSLLGGRTFCALDVPPSCEWVPVSCLQPVLRQVVCLHMLCVFACLSFVCVLCTLPCIILCTFSVY
jgi:hypothetical protein